MSPKYIVIDLFCGAGGTTTGFDMAMINGEKAAHVVACVNHDPLAIKSHWENHPEVKHFEEDIRTLDLTELIEIANYQRELHPTAKLILWASLECTNFSKAKGGQARDADSRTLADHLDRYVVALDPDYVQIENVVEFMSWGPMLNGKPVSGGSNTFVATVIATNGAS
jgi:DNA (cytosine-5)-methyltransferase 1